MGSKKHDMIVTYRSGLLYEVDMVAAALENADIPFFRQEEIGTSRFAMPFQPHQGPGMYWTIIVPRRYRSAARKVIAEVPVSKKMYPDVWGFNPSPGAKKFFKAYAVYYLFATIIFALLFTILEILKK